ncbi:hypothetical protein HQO82_12555 [Rhodococcus fascians]|nr:hypothetical protein [Rhodococcus fascians]MBY4114655.1 hypothetical protein [Rhodococcus fascians]
MTGRIAWGDISGRYRGVVAARQPHDSGRDGGAADTVAAVPTVLKSWQAPHTERTTYYILAALNRFIALLTLDLWRIVDWLVPAHIVAIAAVIAIQQRAIEGAPTALAASSTR